MSTIARLKIALDDVEPAVLRRVEVPLDIRLDRLHSTIQAAMGWTDTHLYEFRAGGVGWSTPDDDWDGDFRDAGKARLGIVVGMNVLNGGTSSSGISGTQKGKYAMSATQLRNWGSTLVADTRTCGFVLHRYEARYFGRTDIAGALGELGRKAGARQATSCRKR